MAWQLSRNDPGNLANDPQCQSTIQNRWISALSLRTKMPVAFSSSVLLKTPLWTQTAGIAILLLRQNLGTVNFYV